MMEWFFVGIPGDASQFPFPPKRKVNIAIEYGQINAPWRSQFHFSQKRKVNNTPRAFRHKKECRLNSPFRRGGRSISRIDWDLLEIAEPMSQFPFPLKRKVNYEWKDGDIGLWLSQFLSAEAENQYGKLTLAFPNVLADRSQFPSPTKRKVNIRTF